ncbi:hypothetical protein [Luteimonas aquatica]|uniref:hypothetical protein n=1 Tax=Luteimonas aquatica TaxID=450364 RepID=UPI001F5A724B|nr:hypothetical protein [Luteimonas aquatica]
MLLKNELHSIGALKGHVPVGGVKIFDRGIATGATQHFRASEERSMIAKNYTNMLQQKGWVLSGSRGISGNEDVVKFCKGTMSLTLDLVSEGEVSTYYYVGIVWAKYKSDGAYCKADE